MSKKILRVLLVAAVLSLACTTKVSEWVLLNAPPDQYTLVYYHKVLPSEPVKQNNSAVSKSILSANIQFKNILSKDIDQPYYALYYKDRLFSKYYDYKELDKLTVSPLREKIAAELMSGKLCVMLFLNSGIREKDGAGLATVKNTIAGSHYGKVIPVIELNRNNPEEKHFISMLLNVESDLNEIKEPMLFGIFGRFKALEPLLARGITEENINLMIDFLTADCSCLIKDNLPGTDILFTNKWDNPATALVNQIIDADSALLHH